jgi:hypothetical protein
MVPNGFEFFVEATSLDHKLSQGFAAIKGVLMSTSDPNETDDMVNESTEESAAKKKRKRDGDVRDDDDDDDGMPIDGDDSTNVTPPLLKRALTLPVSSTLSHVKLDSTLPVEIITAVLVYGPLDLEVLHSAMLVSKAWKQATESVIDARLRGYVSFGSPDQFFFPHLFLLHGNW